MIIRHQYATGRNVTNAVFILGILNYLITWNFRDTLISRFCILRHLNLAILRKFCILTPFNFAFLSEIRTLFLCQCYLRCPWSWSNLINNVQINRNAIDYVNSNKKDVHTNVHAWISGQGGLEIPVEATVRMEVCTKNVEAIERFKHLVEQHYIYNYKERVRTVWGLYKRSATWSGDGKQ